jgi:hypothetical protein
MQGFFHLLFWAFFLSLPFLLRAPSNPGAPPHQVAPPPDTYIILANLLNIPLFYLNAYLLIPKVLKRQGVGWYVLGAVASITVFLLMGALIRRYVFFPESGSFRISVWTVFPVIFLFAVSTSFRILSDYLDDERQHKELANSRLQAELSFLRSQISPHFMFNVLNSLVSLARKKSDLVEPVIISLSDLLRYMLYESDGAKVSLDKEVKYLRNYIELQQLRFGRDVALRLSLPDRLPAGTIEPMLLIPFVENAYKHGVGLITDPYIAVRLDATPDQLTFSVENKVAPGFEGPKDRASGIGLANVRRRLSLLYPDSHALLIHRTDATFRVDLTLHFKPVHSSQFTVYSKQEELAAS